MELKDNKLINIRERLAKSRTWFDKLADLISPWCGSWSFLLLHVIWFAWWLIGSYSINLLTMIVSLEAIILMAVLLMTQQRQAERDDLRDEADYQADVHAEQMIGEVRGMLREIKEDIDDLKKKKG